MGHRSLNNTLTLQLWHGSPGQQRHSVWLISRPPVTSELFVGRRLDFLFHSLLYTLCLCWIFGPDVRYLLCSADPSFLLESENTWQVPLQGTSPRLSFSAKNMSLKFERGCVFFPCINSPPCLELDSQTPSRTTKTWYPAGSFLCLRNVLFQFQIYRF